MENKFGLLGRTLGHSWSPQIHAMLADYDYRLYETEPEALGEFLTTTPLAGMNVTIPYKKDVIPYCAQLSDAARRIGSVNTLTRHSDGWHGDNTDYDGFVHMVKSAGISVAGGKALVFGSGGASLAVKAALADLGAGPIVTISRSGPDNYDNLDRHRDARLLVNTTPLGMYPNTGVSPVTVADFPACQGVLDVVYNPQRTQLLLEAEALGLPHAGGLSMLVAQARRSAELFLNHSIPDGRVTEIVAALSRQMENIILIGMPGCGKTTIGQALAQALHRPFYDADEQVVAKTGQSIPALFAAGGEAGFRAAETAILAELGKGSGAVIATGGGCVTREENYPLLHQNGTIIWLRRALDVLPSDGRPLSQIHSAQTLYEQRKGLYRAFADAEIDNNGPEEETLRALMEVLQ
ncbi:MAG: AAA family ATPase [Oscillospiraceae bacterium]|nr:AAA family ATPase [Oscillospiraceae bacterium]